MATEEQLDAIRRRLRKSRRELVEVAQLFESGSDKVAHGRTVAADAAGSQFPRSRIMRAMTGQRGRKALSQAVLAVAMSRPRMAWRLAGFAPLLRPFLVRYLAQRLLRSGKPIAGKSIGETSLPQ